MTLTEQAIYSILQNNWYFEGSLGGLMECLSFVSHWDQRQWTGKLPIQISGTRKHSMAMSSIFRLNALDEFVDWSVTFMQWSPGCQWVIKMWVCWLVCFFDRFPILAQCSLHTFVSHLQILRDPSFLSLFSPRTYLVNIRIISRRRLIWWTRFRAQIMGNSFINYTLTYTVLTFSFTGRFTTVRMFSWDLGAWKVRSSITVWRALRLKGASDAHQ
jgi:hypothetical protein